MARNPDRPRHEPHSESRDWLPRDYPTPGSDWEEIVHYSYDDFCMELDCPADSSTLNPCARCRTYGRMATDEEQAARKAEMDAYREQRRRDLET